MVCGTTRGKPDGEIIVEFNQDKDVFEITQINANSSEISERIVGGIYGITGILPNIDFIHEWKNGNRELQYGYFRFVKQRQISDLQEEICSRIGTKYALTYCSGISALFEILIYLRETLSNINLYCCSDTLFPVGDIQNLGISFKILDLEKLIDLDMGSVNKSSVLLLALEYPEFF